MRPWRRVLRRGSRRGEDGASIDWLVVGLGNPGPKYDGTRHNIGRDVVLRLARRHGIALDQLKHDARFGTGAAEGVRLCVATPTTYMNESGRAVGGLSRFYKVPAGSVILVYDDLDLPLGRLRVRAAGGAGGHRGVASALSALGTSDVPRLRVGIGRPPPEWDAADYVLSRFRAEERDAADEVVEHGADALETIFTDGLADAMNRVN